MSRLRLAKATAGEKASGMVGGMLGRREEKAARQNSVVSFVEKVLLILLSDAFHRKWPEQKVCGTFFSQMSVVSASLTMH